MFASSGDVGICSIVLMLLPLSCSPFRRAVNVAVIGPLLPLSCAQPQQPERNGLVCALPEPARTQGANESHHHANIYIFNSLVLHAIVTNATTWRFDDACVPISVTSIGAGGMSLQVSIWPRSFGGRVVLLPFMCVKELFVRDLQSALVFTPCLRNCDRLVPFSFRSLVQNSAFPIDTATWVRDFAVERG